MADFGTVYALRDTDYISVINNSLKQMLVFIKQLKQIHYNIQH